jgi:hypothetical protein
MSKKITKAKSKVKPKSKAEKIKNIKDQNISVGGDTGNDLAKVREVIMDKKRK